jgi:guanosine-3',5'-bis(diphosphate) 3'-pyrophosphohydrolase
MSQSREHLAELAQNNPLVLERFDRFVSILKQWHQEGSLSSAQVEQLLLALDFAAERHRFQKRKNKAQTPYISHPIGVANNLMAIGQVKDPAIIAAALLHDTVEDTQTTFKEIQTQFGKEVCGYVQELTDDKTLSKEERKRLQVVNAPHKSAGAAQVKLADKLYNLTDLSTQVPEGWGIERVDHYFHWAEAIVNRLPAVNPPLKEAVDEVIEQHWNNQKK